MATISCFIIGTKSIPFSSGEYEPKIMSYLPFFNPSIFTEVMSWKKLKVIFLFSFSVRKERTIVGINTFARGDT